VEQNLVAFVTNFCNDYYTKEYLADQIDNKTALVRYLLYKKNLKEHDQDLSLEEFRDIQVEHIFSRNPNFTISQYGFERDETYKLEIARLGNLTVLEKDINKDVNNVAPVDKIQGYQTSKILLSNGLIGSLSNFDRKGIDDRTSAIVSFFMEEFYIVKEI
jgi:hypothetical protein